MTVTTTDRPEPRADAGLPLKRHRRGLSSASARTGWIYLAPTLLVVGLVTLFPIAFSVVMSFSKVDLGYSGFTLTGFSADNYIALFSSPRWAHAALFTIFYTVVTVVIELVLGTLVALVLERLANWRGWMMALLLIPWAMITVISAQLWSYMYNSAYGVISWFLGLFGADPVILGEPASAVTAMMVADIWKTTPFVAIIVLAGLVVIPQDIYEAAELDGANAWKTFWQVTLPQLTGTLAIAVLFRVLQAFGVFDLPFVLTGGGPGTSTESLALLGWKVMFQSLNLGAGAAIAVTTGALVLIACLLSLKAFRSQVSEEKP